MKLLKVATLSVPGYVIGLARRAGFLDVHVLRVIIHAVRVP